MLLTTFLIGACFSHLCFPPEIHVAYTNIDVCNICAAAVKISISVTILLDSSSSLQNVESAKVLWLRKMTVITSNIVQS